MITVIILVATIFLATRWRTLVTITESNVGGGLKARILRCIALIVGFEEIIQILTGGAGLSLHIRDEGIVVAWVESMNEVPDQFIFNKGLVGGSEFRGKHLHLREVLCG
jgi:hypothetical protein